MIIRVLRSGSDANCTNVITNGCNIFLDFGIPKSEFVSKCNLYGIDHEKIDHILLSHGHIDHVRGITDSRGLDLNLTETLVWAPSDTISHIRERYGAHGISTTSVNSDSRIDETLPWEAYKFWLVSPINGVEWTKATAMNVKHDFPNTMAYIIQTVKEERADVKEGGKKTVSKTLGYLPDCGTIETHFVNAFFNCRVLMIDCNYEVDLLDNGPYPVELKRRIRGMGGHLSNDDVISFVRELKKKGKTLESVVLMHMSKTNNIRSWAADKIRRALKDVDVEVYADYHYSVLAL